MKTLRSVGESGEQAVTHWESLKYNDKMSLLKIRLETGRTHQIRVHFLSLGAPLIGDRLYGEEREDITHQALHCHTMRFTHPVTGRLLSLCAPMPDDMKKLSDCINCR
ncbi:putative RNA pseudouridine synthase [bioreactor metagenome]|uniref:Putative RNA pseudouridine synthase n=1 Tax=bioreactor metagenome TaxID=1076179 RepID=A0A645E9I4_9ZZZZ